MQSSEDKAGRTHDCARTCSSAAAEAFGEAAVVEVRAVRDWRAAAGAESWADQSCAGAEAKFGVDHPFVIVANLFKVVPEPLLDIDVGAVERAEIIAMLRLDDFAEVGFDLG